jgi:hypothetical protein
MQPMFVTLFPETAPDDLLAEEDERRGRRARASRSAMAARAAARGPRPQPYGPGVRA